MTIDKYTKIILSVIAVGVIGINFQMLDKTLLKKAHANIQNSQVLVIRAPENTRVKIISSDGKLVCKFKQSKMKDDEWTSTGC